MPLIRYALVAAAASALAGAVAAQPNSSPGTDTMPSASNPPSATDQNGAPAAPTSTGSGGVATSGATDANPPDNAGPPTAATGGRTETSAVVNGQTVVVISSPPVPDTPENRAKFGKPLSRAGRATKPAGN